MRRMKFRLATAKIVVGKERTEIKKMRVEVLFVS